MVELEQPSRLILAELAIVRRSAAVAGGQPRAA
jgi:hypothetical protein